MSLLKSPDFETGRLLLVDCEPRTLANLHKSLQRRGIAPQALFEGADDSLEGCFAAIVEEDLCGDMAADYPQQNGGQI